MPLCPATCLFHRGRHRAACQSCLPTCSQPSVAAHHSHRTLPRPGATALAGPGLPVPELRKASSLNRCGEALAGARRHTLLLARGPRGPHGKALSRGHATLAHRRPVLRALAPVLKGPVPPTATAIRTALSLRWHSCQQGRALAPCTRSSADQCPLRTPPGLSLHSSPQAGGGLR